MHKAKRKKMTVEFEQFTPCTRAGCPNNKQQKQAFYCKPCELKLQDILKFEDFNDPDEYYLHIFNGDEDAVQCHKKLLGDWYGMAPRDISNAFAEKVGLGTAADHARRIMANTDAHSPADICSTNNHPVRINGQKYKSLRSWAEGKYPPNKVEYAIHRLRRKMFESGGKFKSNHKVARQGGIYQAELILDEEIPWSDRYQSYGDVR